MHTEDLIINSQTAMTLRSDVLKERLRNTIQIDILWNKVRMLRVVIVLVIVNNNVYGDVVVALSLQEFTII